MGRRNATLVSAGGILLVGTYSALKELLLKMGKIECDLAHVTTSKIGDADPYYSRDVLLKRLIKYRLLFNYNIWNTRDAAVASRLDTAIIDMQTDVSTGALRKQPYCVVLFGPPGVGKSSYAIQIAQRLIKSRHGKFTSHDMVTLNETDEYQSEFRTSHKVVLFDDIGASNPAAADTTNPWRKVIDFVNNVQKTALNPNCEMKGKIYIRPEIVILTSNIDFSSSPQLIRKFMCCPEAIKRRFSKIIKIHSFTESSFINYTVGDPTSSYCGNDFSNSQHNQEPHVLRSDALDILEVDFKKHMEQQTSFVNEFNNYFDDLYNVDHNYMEYTVQSEVAPSDHYKHVKEERNIRLKEYLLENVDWDYHFAKYQDGELENSIIIYQDNHIYDASELSYCRGAISVPNSVFSEIEKLHIYMRPTVIKDLKAESSVHSIYDLQFELESSDSLSDSESSIVSDCEDLSTTGGNILTPLDTSDPLYFVVQAKAYQFLRALDSWDLILKLLSNSDGSYGGTVAQYDARWSGKEFAPTSSQLLNILKTYCGRISKTVGLHPTVITHLMVKMEGFNFTREQINRFESKIIQPIIFPELRVSVSSDIMTEEEHIEDLLSILPIPPKELLQVYRNLKISNLGEIDLILKFRGMIGVFELKRTSNSSCITTARSQAKKYSRILELLQPENRVFGIIYTHAGLEVVYDNEIPYESKAFDNLFKIIGYAKL